MKNKGVITLRHGPRFSGILSTFGMISTLGCTVGTIAVFISGDVLTALLLLAGVIISAAVFLDFRGVVIDFDNRRVKQYHSFLGYRRGVWEPMNQFNKVTLIWGRIIGRSTASMLTGSGKRSTSDSYYVLLEGEEDVIPFEIGEYGSYKAAKSMMKQISKKCNLPFIDRYGEKLASAKKRREDYESRRR